ncbi:MAG: hypothetical protein PHW96_04820 [Candidatus Nanoarchaeia archaeon]|nr:hypothetical protein [Candidatus Nanoarchaeia archaeon]
MADKEFSKLKDTLVKKIDEQNFFLVESLKEQKQKIEQVKQELDKKVVQLVESKTKQVDNVFNLINKEKVNIDEKLNIQNEKINNQNKKLISTNDNLLKKVDNLVLSQNKIAVDVKKQLVDFSTSLRELNTKTKTTEENQTKNAKKIIADVEKELLKLNKFSDKIQSFNTTLETLKTKVDSVKSVEDLKISRLETQIAKLSEMQNQIRELLGKQDDKDKDIVQKTSEQMGSLKETLETSIDASVNKLNVEFTTKLAQLGKLRDEINSRLKDNYSILSSEIKDKQKAGDRYVSTISKQLDIILRDVSGIKSDLTRINAKQQELDAKTKGKKELQDVIEATFESKIKAVQNQINSLNDIIPRIQENKKTETLRLSRDIEDIKKKIENLSSTKLSSIESRFEEKLSEVNRKISEIELIEHKIETVKNELAKFEENYIKEFQKKVNATYIDKIQSLENELQGLKITSNRIIDDLKKLVESRVGEDEFRDIIKKIDDYIDEESNKITKEFENHAKELKELRKTVEVINSNQVLFKKMPASITEKDLALKLAENSKSINQSLSELKTKIAVIEGKIPSKHINSKDVQVMLSKEMESFENKFTKLVSQIKDAEEKFAELEKIKVISDAKKIITNISNLRRDYYSIEKLMETLGLRITKLEKSPSLIPLINEIREDINSISSPISKISDLANLNKQHFDSLSAELKSVSLRLKQAETSNEKVPKLGEEISLLAKRVQELEDDLIKIFKRYDDEIALLESKIPQLVSAELKEIISSLKNSYEVHMDEILGKKTNSLSERYEKALAEINVKMPSLIKKIETMGDKVDRTKSENISDLKIFRQELNEKMRTYVDVKSKYFDSKYDKIFKRFTDLYLEYADKLDKYKTEQTKYVNDKINSVDLKMAELPDFRKKITEEVNEIVNKQYDEISAKLKLQSTKLTDEIMLKSQKAMHEMELLKKDIEKSINVVRNSYESNLKEVKQANKKSDSGLEDEIKEIKATIKAMKIANEEKVKKLAEEQKINEEKEIKELLKVLK